jgi:MoaA/NifB/PqqE/SkfB family radical SAM enzyme
MGSLSVSDHTEFSRRESEVGYSDKRYNNASCSFVWFEITRKCNLQCVHCYNDSGPRVSHGSLNTARWCQLLDEAAAFGVKSVQFIGGEPTLHPDFVRLLQHARGLDLSIEVYSNLVHIPEKLWNAFEECKVSLATSFYSLYQSSHDEVTASKSQEKTLKNIITALSREIPLRVGIVEVFRGQDVDATRQMLKGLGVRNVKIDRTRKVGRADCIDGTNDANELCGSCGYGKCAIDSDGNVFPCVFSRWLDLGNVNSIPLREVLLGERRAKVQAQLHAIFSSRRRTSAISSRKAGSDSMLQSGPREPPECGPGRCDPGFTCEPCDPGVPCAPDRVCNPDDCGPCQPLSGPCDPECDPNCAPDCSPDCSPNCRPNCGPSDDCRPNCVPTVTCDPACDPASACDPDTVCDPASSCDPNTVCEPDKTCDPDFGPCDPSGCDMRCDPACDPASECDPIDAEP